MGATGTGKSRIAVDIAIHFPAEIINSDKMQVYKGLDIVTNKILSAKQRGVKHHLHGEVEPDANFGAHDFCYYALSTIKKDCESGAGLVDEVRGMFHPESDYSKGIRKSIGVREMDDFFRSEMYVEEISKQRLLEAAIEEIKTNRCKLVHRQLGKINRLRNERGWELHRIDATRVLEKSGPEADEAWEQMVLQPCLKILNDFLL
ncbi:hypothetical protein RJ639_045118 [Escallonia herrerae]|uniref:Isopentenyltransferase n=1 Tax=Escallonia herrerae TaxID=1293975 RepID=A0AA89B4P7_9ASTE|nr:hypothetical protein RJ639_045118 [Escallonia herrerae]